MFCYKIYTKQIWNIFIDWILFSFMLAIVNKYIEEKNKWSQTNLKNYLRLFSEIKTLIFKCVQFQYVNLSSYSEIQK